MPTDHTPDPQSSGTPGNFITLVDDELIAGWRYTDPSGRTWDSTFTLRPMPPSERTRLERQHTRIKYGPRGREEITDQTALLHAQLDYIIVDWQGVKARRRAVPNDPNSPWVPYDVPCVLENKIRMPDGFRAAVWRLCVGRDGADDIDAATDPFGGDGALADPPRDPQTPPPAVASPATSTGSPPTATTPPTPAVSASGMATS